MPEHVPTAPELAAKGLAYFVSGGKGQMGKFRVTDEGHRVMGDVMRRNAQEALNQKGTS